MGSLGPGPAYLLPPTIGYDKHDLRKVRNPQYSMAGRLKFRDIDITPGPGINTQGCTRFGRATSQAYSMASRNFAKDIKNCGPGPAHYNTSRNPYVSVAAPPSYSLGRRTEFHYKTQTPGPNAYAINERIIKRSAPGYSIGIKTVLKTNTGSPGPASYPSANLKMILHKAPEYSIYGRTKLTTSKAVGPGANAYDCRDYKPGKSSPAYSFGIRHSLKAPPLVVPCDNI